MKPNNQYYVDPSAFTALFMEFVSVDVPEGTADRLAEVVLAVTNDRLSGINDRIWPIMNIVELWRPWYCDRESRLWKNSRPDEPSRYAQDIFVTTVYPRGIPSAIKRVIWNEDKGTQFSPYVHPEPPAWRMQQLLEGAPP